MNTATLSPPAPRPEHVTDAVFYDFDVRHDPGLLADPHERVLELIAEAPPVFWTPRNGGHWMFMSHEANFTASRDTQTFSNTYMAPEVMEMMKAMLPPEIGHIPNTVPISLDPPDHTKYRIPLNGAFSPKVMNALKSDIRTLAASLLDAIAPRGRSEFMADVAEPMPVQVFLKMMGLPLERSADYRALVKENLLLTTDPDPMKMVGSMQRTAAIMRDTMLERKANPRDDLISALWKTEIDGKPLTLEDMENYAVLLFIAGLDTVMNGIGHAVRRLAWDLPLQRQLRAQPELINDAVEEMLRRYTFTIPPRRVAKDTEFLGVTMKQNDRVFLYLPAADLDPREFDKPEDFNLAREQVHIAFNAGPHRCVGSHLARIELQILYEELLQRIPEFRLDPDHPPTFHGGNIVGVDTVSIIWDV